MRHKPALDGIRAVAVLAVLAHHGLYGRAPGGFLGVDLFFVLSGFLITSLLLEEYDSTGGVSLLGFYRRRALRIVPPLPFAIVLAIALGTATLDAVPPVVLFWSNYVPDPRTLGGLAHTWSLSVEEHFYLAWPLLFCALVRHRVRFLAYIVLIAIGARITMIAMNSEVIDIQRYTHTRMDSLAIGCIAAIVAKNGVRVPAWLSSAALVAIVGLFVVADIGNFWTLSVGFTGFAVLCAVAIMGCDGNRWLQHPMAQWIGKRSYGIYLYHAPLFLASEAFRERHSLLNFLIVKACAVGVTFVVAAISFRLIEMPALRLRRGLTSRARAVTERPADERPT